MTIEDVKENTKRFKLYQASLIQIISGSRTIKVELEGENATRPINTRLGNKIQHLWIPLIISERNANIKTRLVQIILTETSYLVTDNSILCHLVKKSRNKWYYRLCTKEEIDDLQDDNRVIITCHASNKAKINYSTGRKT